MIYMDEDRLVFHFPDVHPDARLTIEFQRTLRIPDDGREYPLPPGLGRFPLRHIDDFAGSVPEPWMVRGGVMLPMYQAEALWLNFSGWQFRGSYPMAVKVATGKVNAMTGENWAGHLNRDPQDYLTVPEQPWLDGYFAGEGTIRQFVAMPLGQGHTTEEQLTGEGEYGGLQILVFPLKRGIFEECGSAVLEARMDLDFCSPSPVANLAMGLAPGGRMRQKIYPDPFNLEDWDLRRSSRCFAHMANSVAWRRITGEMPSTKPPTARDYTKAGLPWFDLYDQDKKALKGKTPLDGVESVGQKAEKGKTDLDEGLDREPNVVRIGRRRRRGEVRQPVAGL